MTIEERAKESWSKRYPEGKIQYRDAQIDGYIQGATEQHIIDKEKLKDVLNHNLYVGDELEDGWLKNSFVERIIKAMEE